MANAVTGLMMAAVAGVANATFTLPMKFARQWAWENIWFVWSVLALIALPVGAAVISIPSPQSVYREAGLGTLTTIALCGAGWGFAQVLFGLSVDSIGIGLAFSIVLGISAAVGSLLPLLRLQQSATSSPVTGAVLLGVAFVLASGKPNRRIRTVQGALCGDLHHSCRRWAVHNSPIDLRANEPDGVRDH